MTKEYIERGALLAEAEYDANFRLVIPAEKARKLPAADVVEVKHGEWGVAYYDDANDLVWDCSACGQPNDFPTNYCPNCGAKMDGE